MISLVVSPETHQEFIKKKKEEAGLVSTTEMTFGNEEDDNSDIEESNVDQSAKLSKGHQSRSGFYQNADKRGKTIPMKDSEVKKKIKKEPKSSNHPSKYFDYTIIILILLSSVLLIADNPLNDPSSTYSKVLEFIDFVFTFLFFIEAMIKIIALGFFWSSISANAYIMNGWNILDFLVVSASLVDFFVLIRNTDSVDTDQLQSLKALRALRALRPLRMISRNEGMRLVVNALFASIPSMTNVLIVCLLFILIFASTGISFFAGTFRYCDLGTDKYLLAGFLDISKIDNRYD